MVGRRKILFIFAGVAIFIFLAAWLASSLQKKDKTSSIAIPSSAPKQPIKELSGKTKILLVALNNSGRDGWLIVQPDEEGVFLNINIDAEEIPEDDHDFPATLRSGSCRDVGEVKHVLTPVYNGGSETILNMTLDQFRESLPLSIVVEESPTDKTVVACGDVTTVY